MAIQKVTSDLIADDAVTAAKIANNTITATQLANNSIGVAQLNLSDGSNGQFLKTNGSGTLSFDTAGGGGGAWTRISTASISSGVANIEVSLTGSYIHYGLMFSGLNFGSNGSYIQFRLANQSGTYSNVKYVRDGYGGLNGVSNTLYGDGSAYAAYAQTLAHLATSSGSTYGMLNIFNVTGQPTVLGYIGQADDANTVHIGLVDITFGFAAPGGSDTIGKIMLMNDGGNNIVAGTVSLYGIATS